MRISLAFVPRRLPISRSQTAAKLGGVCDNALVTTDTRLVSSHTGRTQGLVDARTERCSLNRRPFQDNEYEAVGGDDTFHLRGLFSTHHGTVPDEGTGQVLARPVRQVLGL